MILLSPIGYKNLFKNLSKIINLSVYIFYFVYSKILAMAQNKLKTEISYIIIGCCTYSRKDVLRSVFGQLTKLKLPEGIKTELLIVDNCEQNPSKDVIDEFSQKLNIKVHYCIEQRRGIAFARNRLLKEAIKLGASHIAMFDDDGLPDENWLISHVEAYKEFDQQIISGPQYTLFDKEYPAYITQNNIFKSSSSKEKGEIVKTCATNNVFFSLAICQENDLFFDESYVFMGGEDGDFFLRLSALGYEIVFNPDAVVREFTDSSRANVKWIIKRSYYNGYSGTLLRFKHEKSFSKKIFYSIKLFFVVFADWLFLIFSPLCGRKNMVNAFSYATKNLGKFVGCICDKPLNFYK